MLGPVRFPPPSFVTPAPGKYDADPDIVALDKFGTVGASLKFRDTNVFGVWKPGPGPGAYRGKGVSA